MNEQAWRYIQPCRLREKNTFPNSRQQAATSYTPQSVEPAPLPLEEYGSMACHSGQQEGAPLLVLERLAFSEPDERVVLAAAVGSRARRDLR